MRRLRNASEMHPCLLGWNIQISNVPLTQESTLYQFEKTGLKNYVISLSKSSSHKYPGDAWWVIDGMGG